MTNLPENLQAPFNRSGVNAESVPLQTLRARYVTVITLTNGDSVQFCVDWVRFASLFKTRILALASALS